MTPEKYHKKMQKRKLKVYEYYLLVLFTDGIEIMTVVRKAIMED